MTYEKRLSILRAFVIGLLVFGASGLLYIGVKDLVRSYAELNATITELDAKTAKEKAHDKLVEGLTYGRVVNLKSGFYKDCSAVLSDQTSSYVFEGYVVCPDGQVGLRSVHTSDMDLGD